MEGYRFREWEIPARMMPGLTRYIEAGILPGGFLQAVLANDFIEALRRADDENLRNLPAYGAYLYNECPSAAWGSRAKINAWLDSMREKREAAVDHKKDSQTS